MIAAMPPPNALRLILWITLSAMATGALLTHAHYRPEAVYSAHAYLQGAVIGGLTGAALSSLELIVLRQGAGALRRLPFLPYLGVRSLLYVAVILVIESVVNQLLPGRDGVVAPVTGVDVFFSLAVSMGYNVFFGVNTLLGSGVLFAFVAGRYYHPRVEERALLFIDMRSSTAIAERLGEVRFLDLLNRFIADVSLAIVDAGGEIHKYVGDEVIATWRLAAGANPPACVRACFAARGALVKRAAAYEREFGLTVDFRAALHCGPVVVGELGYLKKEIALIGDTMNTTARMEQMCRDVGCYALASAALLERLGALPPDIVKRPLGALPMRGKTEAIELFALETEREAMRAPERGPHLVTQSS